MDGRRGGGTRFADSGSSAACLWVCLGLGLNSPREKHQTPTRAPAVPSAWSPVLTPEALTGRFPMDPDNLESWQVPRAAALPSPARALQGARTPGSQSLGHHLLCHRPWSLRPPAVGPTRDHARTPSRAGPGSPAGGRACGGSVPSSSSRAVPLGSQPCSPCQAASCLQAIYRAVLVEREQLMCNCRRKWESAEHGRNRCLITLARSHRLLELPADPHHRQNRDSFHGPPCSESTLQWCD